MSELPAAIRKALQAVNSSDTDAFVGSFVPGSGYVNDWGREFRGEQAIRQWSDDELIGKRATLEIVSSYTNADDHVVVIVQVEGDGYTGPSTFTFQVQDQLLAAMRIFA
jgi:hypothetical protein